ncbi:MAG: transposase [Spirochaetales bacterium]|nr:transposase [Spirochaetales bacterium]
MRKPRELYVGAEYHVTARINRGEFILDKSEIKELFLNIVKRAKKKYSFSIYNFSIMGNHIHLYIKPGKKENLSRIMQWVLGVFGRAYNKKYNLRGHVWYDRFHSTIIKSYKQLVATFKYICNNPVKAKMVDKPEKYEYGGLWFIRKRQFKLIEPPGLFLSSFLEEHFKQLLITEVK